MTPWPFSDFQVYIFSHPLKWFSKVSLVKQVYLIPTEGGALPLLSFFLHNLKVLVYAV